MGMSLSGLWCPTCKTHHPVLGGPIKVVAAVPTGWRAHVERLQIGDMRDVGDWWQDQFGELHRVNDRAKITTLHCPHYRLTGLKRPNPAYQPRAKRVGL